MNLYNAVLKFFTNKPDGQIAPEGVCPNCWGSQEYANQIREIEKDVQLEVNRGTANYDFIKTFVKTHVEGFRLINKIEGGVCERCQSVG